jgi:hypothetical protein
MSENLKLKTINGGSSVGYIEQKKKKEVSEI